MPDREKDVTVAYICWILLGCHYFYLREPLKGILYWITGGGFLLWMVIDLFRMKSLVQKANQKIVEELIEEYKLFADI